LDAEARSRTEGEKATIVGARDKFIAEVLKPRLLPSIRPTEFNYPIELYGKWRGGRYRFIERFRSNSPNSIEPEFEHSFARLDYIAFDRFDVMWHRHAVSGGVSIILLRCSMRFIASNRMATFIRSRPCASCS
jgi:hypothetical protein